ncbi:hypothetical protein F5884DRAFT_805488 [Xylogone sp. PMI_703]|nr:hypothetical protein F5884DRAFT_805488 [Xylogone sp. PMI_703]
MRSYTDSSISRSRTLGRRSSSNIPRECMFCGKIFFRSDILRRHYKTCPSRTSQPLPLPLKKGKHRKACDSCARSKLSCDFDLPCESCLARNIRCTYQRLEGNLSISGVSRLITPKSVGIGYLTQELNTSDLSSPTITAHGLYHGMERYSKTSIPFLLNYTNPENRSLSHTFGFFSQSLAIFASPLPNALDDYESNLLSLDISLGGLFPGYFFGDDERERGQLGDGSCAVAEIDSFSIKASLHTARLSRTNEIVDHLTEVSLSLPKDHPESAPNANLVRAISLFSSSNIQRLMETYFNQWHRHSPVVHSGTFSIEEASLPLLISVILTGALYSPSTEDVNMARNMLDLAEECAFQDPLFLRILSGSASEACCRSISSFEAF